MSAHPETDAFSPEAEAERLAEDWHRARVFGLMLAYLIALAVIALMVMWALTY